MRLQEVQQLLLTPHQMLMSVKLAELQTSQPYLATGVAGLCNSRLHTRPVSVQQLVKCAVTLQAYIVKETPRPQAV